MPQSNMELMSKYRQNRNKTEETLRRIKPNHILHIILSVLSGGLWLVVYGLVGLTSAMQKGRLTRHLADINLDIENLDTHMKYNGV